MRTLTQEEQRTVEHLVELKRTGKLIELETARILKNKLSGSLAIKWQQVPKKCLTLYYDANVDSPEKIQERIKEALKIYFEICSFLYFCKELEENKMIAIQTISLSEDEPVKTLYNKALYTYDKTGDVFRLKNASEKLTELSIQNWSFSNIYTDVTELLDNYLDGKLIYPLPLLEDLVSNEFKSLEQRNFEVELNETKRQHQERLESDKVFQSEQIKRTNWSLIIASFALIVSIVIPLIVACCSKPITINSTQLETIKEAIVNSKNTIPDTISIQSQGIIKIKGITHAKGKVGQNELFNDRSMQN